MFGGSPMLNRPSVKEIQVASTRALRAPKTIIGLRPASALLLTLVGAAVAPLQIDMSRSAAVQTVDPDRTLAPDHIAPVEATHPRDVDLILIPAGTVQIGENAGPSDERPSFSYTSQALLMDRTPVTVSQFRVFVKDTNYRTDAERYGSGGVLDERQGAWVAIDGADWRRPTGPDGPRALGNHPVTQVSWYDADIFCRAYGARLPTEFEWERAARIGQTLDGHVFKIGDPIEHDGRYRANTWQGTFPFANTAADGYRSTSPVGAFGTAPSGLTDMAGNVWEWTASWHLPYGAPEHEPTDGDGERVARGGSFLCSPEFCQGYRASARNHTTPDTSLENIGFRCVADPGGITEIAGRVVRHSLESPRVPNKQAVGGNTQ
jgi:sulfatase modifying factor 1